MKAVELTLRIILRSALHIGTGLGLGQILDDRTVQGPHPERPKLQLPYIPGASLKGRLRHHSRLIAGQLGLNQAIRSELEGALFGFAEQPGTLTFADAHLDLADPLIQELDRANLLPQLARTERSFVSLSRIRRVALDQHLFRLELAAHGLPFIGAIRGTLPEQHLEATVALLLAAIQELTHLGGMKGRGLGAVQLVLQRIDVEGFAAGSEPLLGDLLSFLEAL